MVAGSKHNRRSDMATIGSFKKVGNDFQGEIVTLSLQAKGVRIVAEDNRLQRERSQPPHLCGPGRDRGRLVEALRGGPRLPLAQARRPLLQRADLREPVRRRGRRRLHPDLVAAAQERRISLASPSPARERSGGALSRLRPGHYLREELHHAAGTSAATSVCTRRLFP